MNRSPRRRWCWFAFSLRTLLVVVTLLGTVGYVAYGFVRQAMARKADAVFQDTARAWDADTVTTREAFEASVQLLDAELKVPLADRGKARAAHLQRIETIKRKFDALGVAGMHGDDWPGLQSEVDAYYAEAKRMASEEH